MLVVGHRGNAALAPQNTLASFESACRAGVAAVELDVRRTHDGGLVVIHDKEVSEVTDGTGRVRDLDLAAVRALDAGARFSPAFRGQQVPLLREVAELLASHPGVGVLVELKGMWPAEDVRGVVDVLEKAGIVDRALLQSFRRRTVSAARDAVPDVPRGLLVELWSPDILRACERLQVHACNPSARILRGRPGLTNALHGMGVEVYPWTLNTPDEWAAARAAGVDGVITDRPAELWGWLAGAGGLTSTPPAWWRSPVPPQAGRVAS